MSERIHSASEWGRGGHASREAAQRPPVEIDRLEAPRAEVRRLAPEDLPGACAGRPVRFVERHAVAAPDAAGAGVIHGAPFEPARALYLDTETTGLSTTAGTLPFLLGLGWYEGRPGTLPGGHPPGAFVLEQLLLRSPADERAALEILARRARACDGLVTFNGRSFDVPLLDVRYVLQRAPTPFADLPHLDLLHPCRRLFRPRMWSCRLVALEEGVLGMRRRGDVEGHLIPSLYAAYLRTGDAAPLLDVVRHNAQDVLAMPRLLRVLSTRVSRPLDEAEDADELCAIGRMHLRGGDAALGLACLRRAVEIATLPASRKRALCALAYAQRRAGDAAGLADVWRRYLRDFPGENLGYEELAKVYEHRGRDLPAALAAATAAPEETEAVRRRIRRLVSRMGAPSREA